MKYERLLLWTILLINTLILGNVEEQLEYRLLWFTIGALMGFGLLATIVMDMMGIKISVKE